MCLVDRVFVRTYQQSTWHQQWPNSGALHLHRHRWSLLNLNWYLKSRWSVNWAIISSEEQRRRGSSEFLRSTSQLAYTGYRNLKSLQNFFQQFESWVQWFEWNHLLNIRWLEVQLSLQHPKDILRTLPCSTLNMVLQVLLVKKDLILNR